ncbi:MAG: hypothetical protein AWM53_00834 [Candidatus Dichloromethanomonas elyunquensis]|nr:MAG: hypothetical protein AWM53_00834 [Candidatus Dichloromethanomonas elyunquensis]
MVSKMGRLFTSIEMEELNKMLEAENQYFEEQRLSLIQELSCLIHEKELLKERVKKTEEQVQNSLELKDKILMQLYESYISSVEKSVVTIQSVDQSIHDVKMLIENKNSELSGLKDSIKKMKEEFLKIIGRYKNILEREDSY